MRRPSRRGPSEPGMLSVFGPGRKRNAERCKAGRQPGLHGSSLGTSVWARRPVEAPQPCQCPAAAIWVLDYPAGPPPRPPPPPPRIKPGTEFDIGMVVRLVSAGAVEARAAHPMGQRIRPPAESAGGPPAGASELAAIGCRQRAFLAPRAARGAAWSNAAPRVKRPARRWTETSSSRTPALMAASRGRAPSSRRGCAGSSLAARRERCEDAGCRPHVAAGREPGKSSCR
jgi:hypothetical protein